MNMSILKPDNESDMVIPWALTEQTSVSVRVYSITFWED